MKKAIFPVILHEVLVIPAAAVRTDQSASVDKNRQQDLQQNHHCFSFALFRNELTQTRGGE